MAKMSKAEAKRKAERRARDNGTSVATEMNALATMYDIVDSVTTYGSGSTDTGSYGSDSGSSGE